MRGANAFRDVASLDITCPPRPDSHTVIYLKDHHSEYTVSGDSKDKIKAFVLAVWNKGSARRRYRRSIYLVRTVTAGVYIRDEE